MKSKWNLILYKIKFIKKGELSCPNTIFWNKNAMEERNTKRYYIYQCTITRENFHWHFNSS